MKICAVLERFYPFLGGSEKRFFEIYSRLAKKHDVHIYTVRGDATDPSFPWRTLPEYEEIEGIKIHRIGRTSPKEIKDGTRSISTGIRYGLCLARELFKEKFDVYEFNHFPLFHIPLVKYFAKGPVIITWHEVWADEWRKYEGVGKLGKEIEYIVSKLGWHKHVAVSEFTANRLNRFCGISRKNIKVIFNGVGDEFFGATKKEDGKVVFVGRLAPHKHAHDLLIDAFIEAKKENDSLTLHIIGDGPLFPTILERTKDMNDVNLYGKISQSELVNHMKSSTVLCLPSEREGLGIVALEAMATGSPVVTTDYPLNAAAHDLVKNGFNGFIVNPDPKDIAEGILKANHEFKTLTQHCSRFASNFSWDKVASETEQLYLELIGQNK